MSNHDFLVSTNAYTGRNRSMTYRALQPCRLTADVVRPTRIQVLSVGAGLPVFGTVPISAHVDSLLIFADEPGGPNHGCLVSATKRCGCVCVCVLAATYHFTASPTTQTSRI